MTDGKSDCSSDPAAGDFSYPTFVLAAVAPSDATTIATLNQMAVNGGEPQEGGANLFYTTTDDLHTVLDPTASSLATACVVPLAGPLQLGMTLAITILVSDGSGVTVSQDPTNGWEFTDSSQTSIVFNGMNCESLQNGSYNQITITYLCEYPTGLVNGHGHPDGR